MSGAKTPLDACGEEFLAGRRPKGNGIIIRTAKFMLRGSNNSLSVK
ncbi:hypothetical protein [Peribacillus frigoritolerans]|nr:hypothetical protein [Peribacillus frigoritolerans]MCY9137634.1 hypothetical protein [Peribacillus frigoritolerans]